MTTEKIQQLIIHRKKCWFFDRLCLHQLTDMELRVSTHNMKIGLGGFQNNGDLFESPYELGLLFSIPFPGSGWCALCMKAMKMSKMFGFELNGDE